MGARRELLLPSRMVSQMPVPPTVRPFSMSYVSGEDRGQETYSGTALSHRLLEYVTRRVYGGERLGHGFWGAELLSAPSGCALQIGRGSQAELARAQK